jgi:virginiamycin B lyase
VAALGALVLLAVLAATGRVVADRREAGPADTTPATTAGAAQAPAPTPVVATVGTGEFSYGMAFGAGALWVAGGDQVTRIDPADNRVVATIQVAATGSGLAGVSFGAGAVWVPTAVPGTLWAINPATNKVAARISLGGPLRGPISVSATRGAVWVACCGESRPSGTAGGRLLRIDPRRKRVVAEIPLPASPTAVAADPSAAWVATASGRVLVVDPKRNRVVDAVNAGEPLGFSQTIAVGAGGVWLAEPFTEEVVRVDPESRRVVANIPAGAATTLAVAGDAVWVVSSLGLLRIDPARNQVVATASDPGLRRSLLIATGAGAVWTAALNSVNRIDPDLIAP